MVDKVRRYNKASLAAMVAELQAWVEQTEESLDNAENADSPNEERIETLEARRGALQGAIDSLEEIE